MQNPARGIRFSKQKDKTKEVWELTNGEFTELMQQYQRLIYTVCLQFVHDPHTAEDLTQDTFLSAFSAIDRCEPQYYKAWLALEWNWVLSIQLSLEITYILTYRPPSSVEISIQPWKTQILDDYGGMTDVFTDPLIY